MRDGARIGTVGDAEIDTASARLVSIIIYGRPRFFGLFGHTDDLVIHWCDIEVIGPDTILVNASFPPPAARKSGFLRGLWN